MIENKLIEKIKNLNRRVEWLKLAVLAMILVVLGAWLVAESGSRFVKLDKNEEKIDEMKELIERSQQEIEKKRKEQELADKKVQEERRQKEEEEKKRLEIERKKEKQRKVREEIVKRQEELSKKTGRFAGKKLVALTFDDGPSRSTTPKLLDILKEKKVRATFFVLGRMMRACPEVVLREEAEGHEVEGHTMYHSDLTKLNRWQIEADIRESDQVFEQILKRKPMMIRPPYGAMNQLVNEIIGRPLLYWSVDTLDWKYRNIETVRKRAIEGVFDGAVVLMHDIHVTSVEAVPAIIDDYRAAGYEMVTVGELATVRGVKLEPLKSYYGFGI